MLQLIDLFLTEGFTVHFASAAAKTAFSYPLQEKHVQEHGIKLNDGKFDLFVKKLSPDIVLFDRFMLEEQYGWRVKENLPQAIQILDTEDLHFLRKARLDAYRQGVPFTSELLYTDITKREIASILRSDISLIISSEEMQLLRGQFRVSENLLQYLPFFGHRASGDIVRKWKGFSERDHFMFIGNFLHEPNWKTVQLLKREYWPAIRQHLPHAELHIYGAYPSQKVEQLHQPRDGFLIKGRAKDAQDTLACYRVLLAPIPFGAGLKGKFVDSWIAGTPSVTTSIGAEGFAGGTWSGFVDDEKHSFVEDAIQLFQDTITWEDAQRKAVHLIDNNLNKTDCTRSFIKKIDLLRMNLHAHRQANFVGQILQSQQLNALKYMSLWIEEKNRKT